MLLRKYLYIGIAINLIIAFLLLLLMLGNETFSFINETLFNIVIAIAGLYFMAYCLSPYATKKLQSAPRFAPFIGAAVTLIILLFGTICGATVSFITEGLQYDYPNYPLYTIINDYYFKPLFWILYFGSLPTVITGLIIGKKNRVRRDGGT